MARWSPFPTSKWMPPVAPGRSRSDRRTCAARLASRVVVLLGIVAAFVLQAVASYERAATGGIRRLENLDEARVLMAVMTKDVRTAAKLDASLSPFVPAADPDVALADDKEGTFYAYLNMTNS